MKKVSVRKFRNNIAEYLKGLPITITKHGNPIAVVQEFEAGTPEEDTSVPLTDEDIRIQKLREEAFR